LNDRIMAEVAVVANVVPVVVADDDFAMVAVAVIADVHVPPLTGKGRRRATGK